ncbi:MAG: hypothetical protein RIQ72_597 [Candidatus Parcubacteria bacterium]|jgi:predicted nucleotidyltransferase
MQTLETILKKLEQKPEVDAVFLTGSIGNNTSTSDSDIDLIIILKDNTLALESVFTWIDGVFADIYFFDQRNISNIVQSDVLSSESGELSNKMNHLLYAWLKRGEIRFDKSGELTKLKSLQKEFAPISEEKQWNAWVNTNYNFEANTRYFNAKDSKYHEALEMRLLYSVVNSICAYFDFINEQWRGEKLALEYLKKYDIEFYNVFLRYTKATTLSERFVEYSAIVHRVFELNPNYPIWKKNEIIPKSQRRNFKIDDDLLKFWNELTL